MSASLCVTDLRSNEVFADLSEDQLDWLIEHSECLELEVGDELWQAGEPANAMFVILSGQIQLFFDISGQTVKVDAALRSGVTGLLPYSRMTEFAGKTYVAETSRVMRIGREKFPDMLHRIPELGYRLVALLSDRVRDATRVAAQRERMMALGKLAAGLAHELNNPAAAVRRAADDLAQRLKGSNELVVRLAEHGLGGAKMRELVALRERPGEAGTLSPIERSEREDDLGDWLDGQGVDDPWVLAESLVAAGLGVDEVSEACGDLPAEVLPDVLAWIGSGLVARDLLSQVAASSARISDLVASVKSYSHMDQNPEMQHTDIHAGLESTLTMLGHELKDKKVRVEREYDLETPEVPILVSELNQVWTNLIDNAIDASEEGGTLEIRTEHDDCSVFVHVTDNGSGIDPEHQSRIFDPFFTTKPVGEGTGLGLDISHRIVLQHDGEINLESEPGRTRFTVRLPLTAAH